MFRRRFILSALAVTALLALAASAAHSRPLSAAGRRGGSTPPSLVDYTFTTLMIVVVVTVVAVVLIAPAPALGGGRRERSSPVRVLWVVGTLLIVVLMGTLIATLIARHFRPQLKQLLPRNSTPLVHVPAKPVNPGKPPPASGTVNFRWDELAVVLGLGAVLVGLVVVFRPRRPDPGVGEGVETLTEAISQSLDDLRDDPDPRRAIVAAYARMERALAASGVPRRPAEAPLEYLERALLAVDASAGAARRLTELFERAKFSQHEPDAPMRDEAIAALEAIRDELASDSEIAA